MTGNHLTEKGCFQKYLHFANSQLIHLHNIINYIKNIDKFKPEVICSIICVITFAMFWTGQDFNEAERVLKVSFVCLSKV